MALRFVRRACKLKDGRGPSAKTKLGLTRTPTRERQLCQRDMPKRSEYNKNSRIDTFILTLMHEQDFTRLTAMQHAWTRRN
jgi:hypothetical protein